MSKTDLPTAEELASVNGWNKRYREMQDLLHKGLKERKLIVKALVILSKTKDLSFGERKMYDQARKYKRYQKEQNKIVIQIDKYKATKD